MLRTLNILALWRGIAAGAIACTAFGLGGCNWNFGSLNDARSDAELHAWLAEHTPAGMRQADVGHRVRQAGAHYSPPGQDAEFASAALRPPWWRPSVYPYTKWIHFYFDQDQRLSRADIVEWSGEIKPVSLTK